MDHDVLDVTLRDLRRWVRGLALCCLLLTLALLLPGFAWWLGLAAGGVLVLTSVLSARGVRVAGGREGAGRCLSCGFGMPEGIATCPQCGWTYEGEAVETP